MAVSNVTLPNGERVNISHDDGYSEVDILDFAYREYVSNTDPGSAFGRGIRDGVDLLQTSYGSTLEGIGSLLDSESLQQIGADTIAQQRGEIDAEAYRQQQYGDGDDGIIDYAMNLAGSSAPQMGSTFAGAAAGAAIGAGFFGIGAAPGAIIGGFLANMPYFYGDNRERQKEAIERGFRTEIDEGAAALYAVPASILDAAFSAFGAKFLSSGLLKAGGGLLTRATRGAVEGAIIEAPTELGQQFLNRYQAGLPIDSAEAKMEYMEAAKGGALLGGLFGGGGRAVFGSKEGPDAMPASETEETVQMPPSVTTPEGQAASPEVGEILEGESQDGTGGTGNTFGLSRQEFLRVINTPENVADLYPGQDFVTREQADQHKSDLAKKAEIEAELGLNTQIDGELSSNPQQPLTDEDIQRAINTADTLEEQFPGQDSIRQEQMDQYRSDIENKKRVMQELDTALQPDQQAFDESLINRPPPVEQDSMPTLTEEEFEARTRQSPDPFSPDATSPEVGQAVPEIFTAQEEAALEAEMQRAISGDIAPEGTFPVDPFVQNAETEAQPQSIVESSPVTAPAQEVAFKIVTENNPTYDGPGGLQRKVLGYKVRAKDGKDYYIQSSNFDQAPDLRFAVFNGLDPSLGDDAYIAGFPTKKAAVDFLREKKPEAAPQPEGALTQEETEYLLGQAGVDVTVGASQAISSVSSSNDASRVGTSKKGTKSKPVVTNQSDNIDSAIVPDAILKKQMDALDYPSLPKNILNEKDFRVKYEKFVDYIRKNLVALHDKFPASLRATATQWYDGANKIANELASKYNVTNEQASAILAVFSPQKDWFMNVSQAEQMLHVMRNYQNTVMGGAAFDAEVDGAVEASKKAQLSKKISAQISKRNYDKKTAGVVRKKLKARVAFQRRKLLDQLKGKTVGQLLSSQNESDRYLAGWGIRLLAQEKFGRYYNIVNPDGTPMGLSLKKDGNPAKNTWGSVGEISKAVSILNDGSLQNISEQLGGEHKVRNFYNNIVAPNSPSGDATIDTHAVAAGLLLPMGSSGIPVKHNFGGGIPGSPSNGISGLYHAYLDAYRKAASDIGIQPRQMQSITWEAIRLLFPGETRGKAEIDRITKIHNKYENEQDARNEILKPEISGPSWSIPRDTTKSVAVPESIQGFGSDNVLGGDLRFRGRRTFGRTDGDVTAGTDTGPEIADIINEGKTFENAGQLDRFISAVFAPIARKLGVDIVANYSITRGLQYNVTQGIIEYNPVAVINNTRDYLTAGMREELIHAAMHKVLINQNKGKNKVKVWVDFMTKLGKDLTPEQREALAGVYNNLGNDMEFGAEYSRAVIQEGLYGDITEVYAEGKSFDRIKKLFRSIQGFVARTFGSEVSNPEVAGVIRASADLLKAVDPSVRPSNQVVVGAAMNNSVDLNPNSEITSQDVVEAGKPPSKRKIDLNFADKYLFTVSSVLGKIHPRLKLLIRDYYGLIQSKVLSYQTAMAPFFKKMRGIKNKTDLRRLKQLLMYSPMVADAGTAEQEALLAKYGMLEDYRNLVRPALDKLRSDLASQGVEVGDLFDYFPRRIKNFKALQAVKAYWGKTVGNSFRDFIEARNKRILVVRSKMMDLNEELVEASDDGDQAGVQRISQQLKDLSAQDNVIISVGSKETALQEAQEWDKFITQLSASNPDMLPGNARERAIKGEIPDELLQYYEDPAPAMESYIFNMVSASETVSLIGSRFVTNKEGTKMDQASKLGRLIQELRASGAIIDEQADRTIPEIMKLILSPKKGESRILQLARSLGYGTLLVEFTSTLSQLYDLPFIMLDNGFFPTLNAMFGSRLKGSAFGIDTEKISQEFAGDDKFLEKAVRLGLRSTGFTKLDQIMKETNLTANYRRYRKLANLYFRDRNDSRIKVFTAELTALGYSPEEQNQLILDLKKGDQDSALVRSLLFNKLAETQPLTSAEMAMGVVGNPNLRIAVAMKSFMIKQLVFTKDRMLADMFGPGRTNSQRLKASKDLTKLLAFMLLIGVPVDALKDLLAGRVGYLDDYLFDGVFRIAGVSRYTGYKIRTEGIGRAAFDYATPVAFQQAMDAAGELQKVTSGEKALSQSKFVAYAPYSDVINRMFGFQKVKERKTIKRKASEGEYPLFIPPGAL